MLIVNLKGPTSTSLSVAELKAIENLGQVPASPGPVPVPFPNFSPLHISLTVSTKINIDRAQTHGISPAGANQMYVEGQQPKALPDKMVLARFQSLKVTIRSPRAEEPITPTQEKVLVRLMTPELAPPPPPPSSPAGISATTSSPPVSSTLGSPPSAPLSGTSTPTSSPSSLLG